jgi:hypothetical protein
MALIEVEATVAGTRPMTAYGGIRLDHNVLEQLASALRAGRLPMILQHDPTRPVAAKILNVGIADDGDGYERLWMKFEIEEAVWEAIQDEWRRAGAGGGFSWSGSLPLTFIPTTGDGPRPTVAIAADAHFWTDAEIIDAGRKLSGQANVEVAQRVAFAHAPDPVVVVTLYELAKAGVAAVLWDSLKSFFRRAPAQGRSVDETIFEFRASEGGRSVIGRVTTRDEEVLHHAIDALAELAAGACPVATWNAGADRWEAPPIVPPAPH